MDIAIVTGAETPLGLRLIENLIRGGCRVHGIGNNFSKVTFADPRFIAHAIDLSDLSEVNRVAGEILEKEQRLDLLIHAIDVTPGAAFEKLPVGNLDAILKIGLLGPVILTRLALPNLLRFRGQLINIIPTNKSGHPSSAVNALIEGGLREMNTALFDRARDAGLRVTNLILRQNTTIDAGASAEKLFQTRIDPEQVARTIERLIDPNATNIPNEITLHPRLSAEAEAPLPQTALPVDPYNAVVLPPKEYCPPKQVAIPTQPKDRVERTIPYTDEEMEDRIAAAIEDYEAHPERYDTPDPREKKSRRPEPRDRPSGPKERPVRSPEAPQKPADAPTDSPDSPPQQKDSSDEDRNANRRRSRRRGGRNRNKNRDNRDREPHPQANARQPENALQPRGEPREDDRNRNESRDFTAPTRHRSADESTPQQALPKPKKRKRDPERSRPNDDSTAHPAESAEPSNRPARQSNGKRQRRGESEQREQHEHPERSKQRESDEKHTQRPQPTPAKSAETPSAPSAEVKATKKAAKKKTAKKTAKKAVKETAPVKKAVAKKATKKKAAKKKTDKAGSETNAD